MDSEEEDDPEMRAAKAASLAEVGQLLAIFKMVNKEAGRGVREESLKFLLQRIACWEKGMPEGAKMIERHRPKVIFVLKIMAKATAGAREALWLPGVQADGRCALDSYFFARNLCKGNSKLREGMAAFAEEHPELPLCLGSGCMPAEEVIPASYGCSFQEGVDSWKMEYAYLDHLALTALSGSTSCAFLILLPEAKAKPLVVCGREVTPDATVIPLALIQEGSFQHYEPIMGMEQGYLRSLVHEHLKEIAMSAPKREFQPESQLAQPQQVTEDIIITEEVSTW